MTSCFYMSFVNDNWYLLSKCIINDSFIESLFWLSKELDLLLISSLSSFFLIAWVQFLFKEIYFYLFSSYSQSLCLISFFTKFLKCLFASSNLVVAFLFSFFVVDSFLAIISFFFLLISSTPSGYFPFFKYSRIDFSVSLEYLVG